MVGYWGPDTTTHQENWQLVRFGREQIGYVDLAPNTVVKLSDADFPFWLGWEKRSQGSAASLNDGICRDEALIKTYCESGDYGKELLRHVVCKHPSEWDGSELAQRYAGLREPGQPLHEGERWSKFEQHVKKLTFWSDAGLAERSVWHFHPLEFVKHFRTASWLSTNELSQCLPRRSLSDNNLEWAKARERAAAYGRAVNNLILKYCCGAKSRIVHLLAQIYIETGILGTLREGGVGHGKPYGPFYGRGFLQITWAGNYRDYGKFKNIASQTHPHYSDARITLSSTHAVAQGDAAIQWSPRYDPERLAVEVEHSSEASGWFWVSKHFRGTSNINRAADAAVSPSVVAFICWLINGGSNGYRERQQFVKYLINILLEDPSLRGESQFQYPPFGPQLTHFPPVEVAGNVNCPIYYDRQIPS